MKLLALFSPDWIRVILQPRHVTAETERAPHGLERSTLWLEMINLRVQIFSAKAEGVRDLLADCDAVFDFTGDDGWRLQSIRLLKPQTSEEWPQQL